MYVRVCMYVFFYLLTFSMPHYIVILHALQLSIHNMVTYIYNLCTISPSIDTVSLLSVFLCIAYCFILLSTALLTK